MFRTVKRIIDWCGEFKGRLYIGFVFSFLSTWFVAAPIMIAAYTIGMIVDDARRLSVVKSFGQAGASVSSMKKACRDSRNINVKIQLGFNKKTALIYTH